jgi:hypothetical protein
MPHIDWISATVALPWAACRGDKMRTIRVVLAATLLGLFGLPRPFVNCFAPSGASLDIRTEDQLKMSNEDAVFYDPKGGIFRGRDEIDRSPNDV